MKLFRLRILLRPLQKNRTDLFLILIKLSSLLSFLGQLYFTWGVSWILNAKNVMVGMLPRNIVLSAIKHSVTALIPL